VNRLANRMTLVPRTIGRLLASLVFANFFAFAAHARPNHSDSFAQAKPRVVITDDPELDDNNTIIRELLYSTDFKIEGLVYVSSEYHWKGDGKGTKWFVPGREYTRFGLHLCPCTSWRWAPDEHFIDDIVDAYAKVYPNLKVHNPNYPLPDELKSKIKWGNVEFDGDYSKDTDGSNLIKTLLLDNQPGPLYVTAGGGQSTIARALKSIHDEYADSPQWNDIREKVSHKLVIIPFGDQDNTYANYIRPNWPEVSEWQLAMINYGYGVRNGLAPEDAVYVSAAWTQENVSSRGPLGALYRVWGDGKQMVKGDILDYFGESGKTAEQLKAMGYIVWLPPQEKGSFISEGDTPTFMNLLDNGLRAYEDPYYGGWAGRVPRSGESAGQAPASGRGPRLIPPRTAAVNAKFFAAAQDDFAARMKWSVTPEFSGANHEPQVGIKGPLNVSAKPGKEVHLRGEVSDPDKNKVTVKWWQYNDAGTYPGDIAITEPTALAAKFRVPSDAKPGQTIHVILEATDDGTPPLTSYRRVIVTVKP
jgi:Protein of unknown function (DUF1593)